MPSRIRVFSTSVGTKLLIGVTGFALVFYLIIHIAGNLTVFAGPAFFNKYAFTLESNPLIPVIEIGLLLIALIHVYKTVRMYLGNQQARPVSYVRKKYAGKPSRKTLASSTMIVSGLWLVLFLIIHVPTFRSEKYEWAAGGRDLYRIEMEAFSNPLIVAFYVVSMIVVGSHLWHGSWSFLQSLGVDHPKWTPRFMTAGRVLAVVIAGGFIAIAIWAYFSGAGRVQL
jgi:succinate dehydrogenase / fumarate reductase cytochrome b subunit